MRKHTCFCLLFAMFFLAACNEQPEIELRNKGELVLNARTECPTKTVVTDETNVYWEPGDAIAVFSGDSSGRFVTDLSEPAPTATFKGSLVNKNGSGMLWALYPYDKDASFDGECITTVLPSTQIARANSFGKDMNLSVARTAGNTLQFYNVGGGVCFTVKEEGIKKVMVEGLDGEIISGTVKIGFDENGLPEVREVTGGSQFITLLPPEGETFQTDTWYYIVAIPGTLEKGYKMRFYKTDDYARRISENAVTIKRSIYGNIANADDGLGYEPTTANFPETEEEWKETERQANEIGPQVHDIITNIDFSDIEKGKDALLSIDGVINAYIDQKSGAVSVLQKDSVWLNFFLDDDISVPGFRPGTSTKSVQKVSRNQPSFLAKSINADKKALILAPYSSAVSDFDDIKESLIAAGFSENNVRILIDKDADILLFKGDNLMQYKCIYIFTHGGVGYRTNPNDDDSFVENQTCLLSGTKFSPHTALTFILNKQLKKSQIALAYHGSINSPLSSESELDYRFCMIPSFLESSDFRTTKPYVYLGVCSSDELEHSSSGSLVNMFLSKGVGAISGFSATINQNIAHFYAEFVSSFLSNGFSFQKASKFWKESDIMAGICTSLKNYYINILKKGIEITKGLNQAAYNYYPLSTEYNLINPYPTLLSPPQENEDHSFSFSWECELKPFDFDAYYSDYHEASSSLGGRILHGNVEYDLYIDDFYVKTISGAVDSAKQVNVEVPSCGDHSWYVVGKLILDGNVEETYKSGEGHFTTTGIEPATPTAIDLGLPSGIKWASFNVGASRPEDPGDFFAWGETEPKQVYSWSTYKWCEGSANTLTKYNTLSSRGFVDNKTILELDDDVAHVRWGGSWRMPTKEEYNELFENCTWSLLDQNDESVIVLTSKINAETLIIPEYGCFWHSTIDFQNKDGSNDWRYIKYCVRPVTDEGVRIPVTGVSMKRKELTLTLKAMSPIPVIVSPSNATQPAIIWSSSNLDVATVDINGTVKAVSPGKTTITATTYDGGYSATMELTVVNGYAQPEAVDLGLPSGVKWASFNVGATKPEEYGNFYAWGETEPKDNYEYSNFKWINSDKYNAPYSSLDREDDAAAVNLGGVWRMPTSNEVSELKTNCNWTWTQKNGINGYLVESKKNNNSIFLPASGVRINNQFKDYEVSGTYLCSDRAHHDSAIHCLELHFDENDYYPNAIHGGSSSSGITIRAVCE